MNRIQFSILNFPKFYSAKAVSGQKTLIDDFTYEGFKSIEVHSYETFSLSEEEYTWFTLRWSS